MRYEDQKGKVLSDWNQREIKELLQQLVVDPENIKVLTRLGRLHFQDSNQSIAFNYLWQAETASREVHIEGKADIDVLMAIGELLMRQGSYKDARRKYQEVLSIDIRHRDALKGKRLAETEMNKDRVYSPVSAEVIQILYPNPHKQVYCNPDRLDNLQRHEIRLARG